MEELKITDNPKSENALHCIKPCKLLSCDILDLMPVAEKGKVFLMLN
jgi:hypothetical protein